MLHFVKNEFLTVAVSGNGAELQSLLFDNTEFIWQGDAKWWGGRSPILFPFIGRLKDDKFTYDGKEYASDKHGFARGSKFTLVKIDEDELVFSLLDDKKTLEIYPFKFELKVSYKLLGRTLRTDFTVKNKSEADMFFSIGGHPAFNCPLLQGEVFEDYSLIFNEAEARGTHIVTEDGYAQDKTEPFFNGSNKFSLNSELFSKYLTLLFSNLKSTNVTLQSSKTGAGVMMDYSDFEYLGIWQPPGAPFVCIEPWLGISAPPNCTGSLRDKKGIIRLAAGSEHSSGYTITPML